MIKQECIGIPDMILLLVKDRRGLFSLRKSRMRRNFGAGCSTKRIPVKRI